MASPYVLPPDQNTLRGGCTTPDGTLTWHRDQAYVWTDPSEGWFALAAAPSRIIAGHAVPRGVIAHGNDAMGFWAYGDREWTWWRDELAFQSITMPVNGWMLGQIPEEGGNECALLHCTEEGLQ